MWLLTQAKLAHAYTIESPISSGCHEHIVRDAYRAVRSEVPIAGPIPKRGDDDAIIADLPFRPDEDLKDEAGLALLIGIRYPDLQGLPTTALSELTQITAYENEQNEHCLRTRSDVEPNGTRQAIADCRTFMLTQFISALDGLDANGAPDPNLHDEVRVGLVIRRTQTLSLQRFYFRIGEGLHTLADSFAHTYRNAGDQKRINVALDWIDYADNTIDEPVTGPPHLKELDRCDDPDSLRTARHQLAVDATYEILRAALEPSFTREQKINAFTNTMNKYASFDETAHCTVDNGWCDAPENALSNPNCACRTAGAGAGSGTGAAALGGFAALGAAFVMRRRNRKRAARAAALTLLLVPVLVNSPNAQAQEVESQAGTRVSSPAPAATTANVAPVPADAPPADVTASPKEADPNQAPNVRVEPAPKVSSGSGPLNALEGKSASAQPGVEDAAGAFFLAVGAGASWDNPAFFGRVGGRYQISSKWMVGLDAEWNPYIAIGESTVRAGGLNIYASVIRRFQLAYERVNLRTTLSLGGSVLLFDLVGAPSGSFGPFIGASILGLEYKVARGFYLTFDPTYYAIPVPHVTGVPFVYPQWRPTIGIEFGG